MKGKARTALLTLVLAAFVSALVAAAFVVGRFYNIAADEQHTAPVYHLLDYAMRRSVKVRAGGIEVPELKDQQRVRNGLAHYRRNCLQCHGAPGVAPDAEAIGMTPAPVNLVPTAREWPAQEIYWVVRHGIKMSGMPAWERQLNENELWEVVAFIKAMPGLSPTAYSALSREIPEPARAVAPAVSSAPASRVLGDAIAGKRALDQYLCAGCHVIPGVVGANRHVGPPLTGMGTRQYIAGVLPNKPENMVHWIRFPQQVDPSSAMPDLGVSDKDARDMAAYLYSLDE
jgi:mono/diheme cytochrome c family protein